MDTVWLCIKCLIVLVVGVYFYQWKTGDMRIQHKVEAMFHGSQAERLTASASAKFNKVIGDDLKKSNPTAAIKNVQKEIKAVEEVQKKRAQELENIENR